MTDARPRPAAGFADAASRKPPVRTWLIGVALGLLVALSLLGPFLTSLNLAVTGEGSPVRQGGYFVCVLLAVAALRPLSDPARLLAVPWPITIALAWCLFSISWALDPDIAARRLVLTAAIIWTIFATVPRLGYERTVLLLQALLAIAVIASYGAVVLYPAVGIHTVDELWDTKLLGDWRGVFLHKNAAGAVCAFAAILFAFERGRMPRALQLAAVAAAALFLWKSGSRTSVGVCAAALLAGFLFMRYHARYRLLVVCLACALALGVGVYLNIWNDPLLQHTNDPDALTGRTLIWAALWRFMQDYPMGAGFGSFWNIGPDGPIYQYATGWVLEVKQGHNGFIDLIATIGWPGLAIVVFAVIVMPLVRLLAAPMPLGQRGALVLAMIAFAVGHNATESSLFERDVIVEVFLMLALALLWTITALPSRRAAPAPRRAGTRSPFGGAYGSRR